MADEEAESSPPEDDQRRHRVLRQAVTEALGFPAITLFASMTGFGSLVRETGLDLGIALAATAGVWGLPGQLALVELYAAGGELAAIVSASSLANARFLPMAVVLIPLLQQGLRQRFWAFVMVQFMSINTWAAVLRTEKQFTARLRRLYFSAFAAICMSSALLGTTFGYLSTGTLPRPVTLGLIFMNPVFFAILFASMRGRATVLSLVLGAILGPVLHLISPDWGLLATGVLAGTVAFALSSHPRFRDSAT